MDNFKRGNTLKLSKEGMDWLYKYATPRQIELAKARRFEFRGFSRRDWECIVVKLIRGGIPTGYQCYHKSFLEKA